MRASLPAAALALIAVLLSACGLWRGPDLPEAYGLYAVEGNRHGRLDGDPAWEQETWPARSELSPEVTFLVHERSLLAGARPLGDQIRLYRVAAVRSEFLPTGERRPAEGARWVAAELGNFRVPVDIQPVPDRPEMVRVLPRAELEPGIYELRLLTGEGRLSGRLGVRWPEVDQEAYAEAHCVDRYRNGEVTYRPCDEAPEAPELRIVDVRARHMELAATPVLIVEGVLVNAGAQPVPVPPLRVVLHDAEERPVHEWTFRPDIEELAPGDRHPFLTEAAWPPEGVVGASVRLEAEGPS